MKRGNLMLHRKVGDSIELLSKHHEPILVDIVEIRGNRVVVGIKATSDINIRRPETIPSEET